jgi:hypothetical protein
VAACRKVWQSNGSGVFCFLDVIPHKAICEPGGLPDSKFRVLKLSAMRDCKFIAALVARHGRHSYDMCEHGSGMPETFCSSVILFSSYHRGSLRWPPRLPSRPPRPEELRSVFGLASLTLS